MLRKIVYKQESVENILSDTEIMSKIWRRTLHLPFQSQVRRVNEIGIRQFWDLKLFKLSTESYLQNLLLIFSSLFFLESSKNTQNNLQFFSARLSFSPFIVYLTLTVNFALHWKTRKLQRVISLYVPFSYLSPFSHYLHSLRCTDNIQNSQIFNEQ